MIDPLVSAIGVNDGCHEDDDNIDTDHSDRGNNR